jgi:hypothetical protein
VQDLNVDDRIITISEDWQDVEAGTVRQPRGKGIFTVKAATKQRLVKTEKTVCLL